MLPYIQRFLSAGWRVYLLFWLVLFALYVPAANCGWVSDTLGWLDALRHQSFRDYLNRTHTGTPTFYQITQIITWGLYHIIGTNRWAWHIIHLSLHALNCTLLYNFCRGLLNDNGLKNAPLLAFIIGSLFCTSPYVSEVIVWKASFHYLQGLCFILLILILLRKFLHHQYAAYPLLAGLIFLLSCFSLELFYLTPCFTLSLIVYYRVVLRSETSRISKAFRYFLIPQCAFFTIHLLLVWFVLGTATARLGNKGLSMPLTYYAIKPPDYLLHLLWGRFLPQAFRSQWHAVFCTYTGAGLFYGLLLLTLAYIVLRFKQFSRPAQLSVLIFLWLLMAVALVSPLWFPERLLILGDRYLYILLPLFFALLVVSLSRIPIFSLKIASLLFFIALNSILILYLSTLWQRSERLTHKLQSTYPLETTHKVTILLNNPNSLRGAHMIGAATDHEFQLMHNLFYVPPITDSVIETLAYDMRSTGDTTAVCIINDSTLTVSLTNPDSRWWYGPDLAKEYTNQYFQITLPTPSTYQLRLKGNPAGYRLLYQRLGYWHIVNLNLKPVDQSH